VSSCGHVLITSIDLASIIIYGPDAFHLRTVKLCSPMTVIPHVKGSSLSGNFLLGGSWNDWSNILCEVSSEGELICSYDIMARQESTSAKHLATDVNGNIYVADSNNYRVLVFDSNLCIRRVIQTNGRRGDKGPWWVCYSQDTQHLIVRLDNFCIDIYSFHSST